MQRLEMTSHSEIKYLPYTAKEMFDLVADISSYPEFLPWCAAARIRKKIQKGVVQQIEADLVISFKVFREKFGSRVLLDKPSRRETEIKADWTGFEIPDEFVVGYGIDYAQRNRNLSFIGTVKFV